MDDQVHEDLNSLLRRFLDPAQARAAAADIRAGDQLLGAFPAPVPSRGTLGRVKAEIRAVLWRRYTVRRIVRRSLAAAAVIAFAAIMLLEHGPASQPAAFHATLLPAAIWDSDNIAADDLDLVYFTTEVRQIEAQLAALDAGDEGLGHGQVADELETELAQIETEYWKGR
jgi:hypothetical protein